MKKVRNAIIKLKNLYSQWRERRKLKSTDFTIISNNCWGGFIYQQFGLEYTTPTIGMGFIDDDYIKFLEQLDYYLSLTPIFIDPKDAPDYDLRKKLRGGSEIDYPVAKLDNITLWFTHYHSKEEALVKWERRKQRINHKKLLIKWSQRYNQSPELLERFLSLPYTNKIAFVEPTSSIIHPQVIKVPELVELNRSGGDETEYTLKQIDKYKLLNSIK